MNRYKIDDQELGRALCRGKKIYDKKGAITVKNFRSKKQGVGYLRIYHCRICGYWHLTHTELYEEQTKRKKRI